MEPAAFVHLWVLGSAEIFSRCIIKMQEQSIFSILGLALLFWWATSGRGTVSSIQDDIASIEKLAEPYLRTTSYHRRDSRIFLDLDYFVGEIKTLENVVSEEFQTMGQKTLETYLSQDLPPFAERVQAFHALLDLRLIEVSEGTGWVDGIFKINSVDELVPLRQIVELLYDALRKVKTIGAELLQKLLVPSDTIAELLKGLDVVLGE